MKRQFLAPLLFLSLVTVFGLVSRANPPSRLPSWYDLLALAWPERLTPEDLQTNYETKRLRVLLVPGHDNEYRGAEFGRLTENSLTMATAGYLFNYFKSDPRFEVFITRDPGTGDYLPNFLDYFNRERENILVFKDSLRQQFANFVAGNQVEARTTVVHNFARPEVAFRLYGINKWANDNNIDLVLHLHFNDYPGRGRSAGKYSGFSVYLPEWQYPNARTSAAIGQSVFSTLQKFIPTSSLPGEDSGLVEDQELIAIGASGSRDGASVLIEYGYIYESQFTSAALRGRWLPELAWQTYWAVKNHFDADRLGEGLTNEVTTLLPYHFTRDLREGDRDQVDVLALQRALLAGNFYPPAGKSLADCPILGSFGRCTREAVSHFQKQYQIKPVSGAVDEVTRKKLNELYASDLDNGLK